MEAFRVIWLDGGESFHRTSDAAVNAAMARTGAADLKQARPGLWIITAFDHAAMGVIEQIQIGE